MSDTPPKQPRVVVAEDEALIRLDLVELLTGEGYEVVGEGAETARRHSSSSASWNPTWS